MKGATEYSGLFTIEQVGRLYIVPGSHARGETLQIWAMPSEEPYAKMPWTHPEAVEVYGVTGGQLGWTECYGWLHAGKWQEDFAALVEKRKALREELRIAREQEKAAAEATERDRKSQLLRNYI